MKKVKKTLRKNGFLILAALAVSCIILTALASCEKARETQAISDSSESAVNSVAPISPDVMNELDVAALIGENRFIHNKTFISDTVIVIISSDVHKNGEYDLTYYNWKVNFIDLAAGSSISHPLREAEADFSTCSCQVMDEYLYIWFNTKADGNDGWDIYEYKIKVNSNNNSEDIVKYYPYKEVPEIINLSITKLEYDSGRYYTFINDYDLYLHDTVTGKDTLIYNGYYVDNPDEHDKNRTVEGVFAVNDTIYFNIVNQSGNGSIIGSGAYNITANQFTTFENNIYALLYWDGYIYGCKGGDARLLRFKPDSPDTIETVDPELFNSTYILFTPSGRFIVKIDYNDSINTSTITIYNTADYSVFKSYTYNDSSSFIYLGRISDKYIYLTVESTVYDNKAYIISLP